MILTAQKPDRLGRKKTTPAENYENIYNRGKDAIRDFTQISSILSDIEKYSNRFEYARRMTELFHFEKLEPFLKGILSETKQEGAPIDDTVIFDKSKMNMNKVLLASNLLKYSSDYLIQAFPGHEYKHLGRQIENLVNELKGMQDTFNRNLELQRQLDEMRKHLEYHEPPGLGSHDSVYDIACIRCRSMAMGKTLKEVSENIKHTEECIAEKKYDETNPYKWLRWYQINYPQSLIISWKEREILDKAKRSKS